MLVMTWTKCFRQPSTHPRFANVAIVQCAEGEVQVAGGRGHLLHLLPVADACPGPTAQSHGCRVSHAPMATRPSTSPSLRNSWGCYNTL